MVIYPVSAFRVAVKAIQEFYTSLHGKGDASEFPPQMMTRNELYQTIQYYDYETLDDFVVSTVLEQ